MGEDSWHSTCGSKVLDWSAPIGPICSQWARMNVTLADHAQVGLGVNARRRKHCIVGNRKGEVLQDQAAMTTNRHRDLTKDQEREGVSIDATRLGLFKPCFREGYAELIDMANH